MWKMGNNNNNNSSGEDMQQEEEKAGLSALEMGVGVATAVGAGLVAAWGLVSLLSSSSETETAAERNKKMMKAPGRNSYISRQDFEDNPSKYFRNLRKH